MKKLIIMSVMLHITLVSAQASNVQSMTATSFSVRYVENSYYGSYWTDWSQKYELLSRCLYRYSY